MLANNEARGLFEHTTLMSQCKEDTQQQDPILDTTKRQLHTIVKLHNIDPVQWRMSGSYEAPAQQVRRAQDQGTL